MKKSKISIVLAIVTMFIGVALCITGIALGGRLGSVHVESGEIIYVNRTESLRLGDAPSWWKERWNTRFSMFNWDTSVPFNFVWGQGSTNDTCTEGLPPASGNIQTIPLDFTAQQVSSFKIDVSAAYVTIQTGDELSLEVQGNLPYTSSFKNGEWAIKSESHSIFESSPGLFFIGGQDVTTYFTITIPKNLAFIDADLDIGEMTITGINSTKGEFEAEASTINLNDCNVQNVELDVGIGEINLHGFICENIEIDVGVGNVYLIGEASGIVDIDCGTGRIDMNLSSPTLYAGSISIGIGSVTIDGQDYYGPSRRTFGNTSDRPFFDIDCGIGDVNIEFTR